jgi:hypothetical protein
MKPTDEQIIIEAVRYIKETYPQIKEKTLLCDVFIDSAKWYRDQQDWVDERQQILTNLSEMIRSFSRIANNYPKIMSSADMKRLSDAQITLAKYTVIDFNEVPQPPKTKEP